MNAKLVSLAVFGVTAVSMGAFFDGVYGGEPITIHRNLVHVATVGAALFGVASVLSLFRLSWGPLFGIAAALLSWPYFGIEIGAVPWSDLGWYVRYRPEHVAAIGCLTIASVHSLTRLRADVRART